MAAASNRSTRARAIALASILLLPAASLLIPTASATHPVPTVSLVADKSFYKLGDTIVLSATVNAGTGCTSPFVPTVTSVRLRQAEADRLGWSTLEFTAPTTGNVWTLSNTIGASPGGQTSIDNASITFEATATSFCRASGQTDLTHTTSQTGSGTTSPIIDNVAPTGSASFSFTTVGKYRVSMSGVSGVASVLADLRGIGLTAAEGLPTTATSTTDFTVASSTSGTFPVTVTVNDSATGPANLVTTTAPRRLSDDLQVFPIPDNRTRIRFSHLGLSAEFGIAVKRPTSSTWDLWSTTHPAITTTYSAGVYDIVLPGTLVDSGQPNLIRVFQHSMGSDGVPSPLQTVVPAYRPNSLNVTAVPTGAVTNIGVLSGEAHSDVAPKVRVALQRAADNLYWQNDTDATFGVTPVWAEAHYDAATKQWVTDALSAFGSNGAKVVAIPDGSYRMVFRLVAASNDAVLFEPTPFPIIIDRAAPTYDSATTRVVPTPPTDGIMQGSTLRVQLNFTDASSSIKNVSFQLRQTGAPNARVVGADGALVQSECSAATPACILDGAFGAGTFRGNVTVTIPYAPTGTYQLVFLAYDAAGNKLGPHVPAGGATVKIVPAVQARWPELRGDSIHVDLLAAYVAAQSVSPSENCAQYGYVCKPSQVVVLGRNGATGEGQTLATLVAPRSQMSVDGGRSWWNYTFDSGVGSGTLSHTQPMQIKVIARATLPGGSTTEAATSWLPVSTPSTPGGIQWRYPNTDWLVNSTGTLNFALNLTLDPPASEPYLRGTIRRLDTAAADVTIPQTWAAVSANQRPKALYNYSFPLPSLPDGQYAIDVRIYTNESEPASNVLAHATRYFAVEREAPQVFISNVTQPALFLRGGEWWTSSQFFLHTYIDPGFANVSATGLNFKLHRNVRGTGNNVLNNTESGFSVLIENPSALNPIDKDAVVVLNVTLPSDALDGDVFTLEMSATSDAVPVPHGTAWRNRTNVTHTFRLDLGNPSAGVLYPETNATALSAATQLQIKGFATDGGAGVREVQVRLVNVSSNRTWHWGGNSWTPGTDANLWATTHLAKLVNAPWARNVGVYSNNTASTVHTFLWALNETDRPTFDATGAPTGGTHARLPIERSSHYRVDIRVVDMLGRVSEFSNDVSLDPQGPVLHTALSADPGPWAWHGPGNFSVTVSDNWCVARVSLMARTDDGEVVGPADFKRPAGSECRGPLATAQNVWTLNVSEHPAMTDRITNYTYWVQAVDAAGNVTETPLAQRTLKREILDTHPAIVKFLRLEPPLVGPGARSRVVAEVFEVGGIDRVRVFLHRVNADRTYTQLGEGVARPLDVAANGTGEWVAESDTDLGVTNLTLGDYLWEVRPMDKSWESTCAVGIEYRCPQEGILLRVVSDAGIFIQPEAPAASATIVNATPVFRWTVFDDEITASGITVRAGDTEANLTAVSPTSVRDLPLSGTKRTGVVVEYRPNLTTDTFAVQLLATASGITNETPVRTFSVDGTAPVVNATATGTVPLGGREYGVSTSRVTINATDANPVTITYTVNGGAIQTYTGPVTPSGPDGAWRLDYVATDAAGNVARGTLTLTIDRTGPSITVAKHGDEVVLTVTDEGAGLNETTVRVFYAYGDASTFTPLALERLTGNSYRAQLPGNATETGLKYHFEARDILGNTGTRHSAADPYEIEASGQPTNLPPTLRITAPAANAGVRERVELRWLAEDPEGENLTVTIALRSPTGQGRILQTAGPNNGSFAVDLVGAPAGTHTLVVTASDGEKTAQESVNFVVERGEVYEMLTPPPVSVKPDQNVPFAVRINAAGKPIEQVTYTLRLGNETVAEGPMLHNQGTYSAELKPGEPGRYSVLVSVRYADGSTEPQRQVAVFGVAGETTTETSGGFPTSLLTLVVLALVTIGLAAYAAFVRWGR